LYYLTYAYFKLFIINKLYRLHLGTHTHMLEESVSHWHTRWVTQLFTYILAHCRTACHAHIGLFTFPS